MASYPKSPLIITCLSIKPSLFALAVEVLGPFMGMVAARYNSLYSYFAEYPIRVKAASPKDVSYYMFVFGLTHLLGALLADKMLSKSLSHSNVAF